VEDNPTIEAREKDVIEWDWTPVAGGCHVADKFGSEMPLTQPGLEPSDDDRVIGGIFILEFALVTWRFGLAIGTGIFVPNLVLNRWAQ
jgi:hypothetical protein